MYINNIKWKQLWKEFDEILDDHKNIDPMTQEQSRDLVEELVVGYEEYSHKQWCTGLCPCEQKAHIEG